MIGKLIEGAVGGAAWGAGFAAAAGAALLGGTRGKPLAKRAMKTFLVAQQRGREMVAEGAERIQDVYAEAKYEYEAELAKHESGTRETSATGTGGSGANGKAAAKGTRRRRTSDRSSTQATGKSAEGQPA
jgi:hypothetical protein